MLAVLSCIDILCKRPDSSFLEIINSSCDRNFSVNAVSTANIKKFCELTYVTDELIIFEEDMSWIIGHTSHDSYLTLCQHCRCDVLMTMMIGFVRSYITIKPSIDKKEEKN